MTKWLNKWSNGKWLNSKWTIIILIIVVFVGCRPKGILTSRQMRRVLYDLHRAEAILQVEGLYYGHDEELARYYEVVLDKNHVTKAEFDSSLVWYTDHPQLFNKIYPTVLTRCQEETKIWQEWAQQQENAGNIPARDLPSIEDVTRRLQHGWDSKLFLGDTVLHELLLPLQLSDSLRTEVATTKEKPVVEEVVAETSSSLDTELEQMRQDSLTPEERKRKHQMDRIFRKFMPAE